MLQALDHVTVRCTDLERAVRFYEAALGLARGPRLSFSMPGCWLYLGGRAVLHLMVQAAAPSNAGAIDHVAFAARDRAAFEQRLAQAGVPYRLKALPDASAQQLFVHDPEGVRIELVFQAPEDR